MGFGWGVFKLHAGFSQLVADAVGEREVFCGAGGVSIPDALGDESGKGRRCRIRRRGVPRGSEGVDAEHIRHGNHLRLHGGDGVDVISVKGGIAGANPLVQDAERLRNSEVIVHCRGKRLWYGLHATQDASAIEPAGRPLQEHLDAFQRGRRLDQGAVVVIDGGALVGGTQVVPHHQRTRLRQKVGGED